MIKKSTLLHLRIPFSLYLMPVFFFSLAISTNKPTFEVILTFILLHLFLYPASNAYNSYFDKDEESIGLLKHPPPVSKQLYFTSLLFDGIAIVMALTINWLLAVMVFVYGLVSKAYSHPTIRLKAYPFSSLLIAAFFQGSFTFLMVQVALNDYYFFQLFQNQLFFPSLLSSLMIVGYYPLTQIYQHTEDMRRSDITMSIVLGKTGTFIFAFIIFILAGAFFLYYFMNYHQTWHFYLFLIFIMPVVVYLVVWYKKVKTDVAEADYDSAMRLQNISAVCMNLFFIIWMLLIN